MATMQQDTALDVGKRWVEEAVKRVAGERRVPVAQLRWRDDYPGAFLYTLNFDVQGAAKNKSIELSLREVEECRNPARQTIRAGIEDQIRKNLQ